MDDEKTNKLGIPRTLESLTQQLCEIETNKMCLNLNFVTTLLTPRVAYTY